MIHTIGRGHSGTQTFATRWMRVLVIEPAHGEPKDLRVKRATRGAEEWVNLIRASGRELFPYLLWLNWPDVVRQVLTRHEGGHFGLFLSQLETYLLYVNRNE